jgi:hypothetical protein
MSVFKYADNSEPDPSPLEDDGLDEVLNEGDPDEGVAPLGAELIEEKDEVEYFVFDKSRGGEK